MDIDVAILALWFWLLPMVTRGRVIRNSGAVCETYYYGGSWQNLVTNCSNLGLNELPDNLNTAETVTLDLSNNNFVDFPESLRQFHQLHTLEFSGNGLSSPPPYFIGQLFSLVTLNLSNNNYNSWIKSGQRYFFVRLDLSKNSINAIDDGAFNDLPRFSYLDLSANRLQDLALDLFSDTGLETLILTRNFFSSVPKFVSSTLTNLALNNCLISEFPADSLSEMNSILQLDLSINMIESIPENLASSTLQELDLSYNYISTLNMYSFSSLPHLAVLDLRGNRFTEIWSTSYFSSNPFLREIHLSNNLWSCDGFSVNLFLTYDFLTKEPPKVSDASSLICHSPSNVTGISWREAYIRTWHPEVSSSTYTYVAVTIGLVLGILLTSLVCRCLIAKDVPELPRPATETTILSDHTIAETTVMRIPLHDEDLPPSYDEALLMPRLNSSFHSLPDFVDLEETTQQHRRSMSIGDLADRPRTRDRRSMRHTVEVRISDNAMTIGRILICVLFLVLVINGEVLDFDDRNYEEFCNLCHCNEDITVVDCSRRGLTDLPSGIDKQVTRLNLSFNEISTFPRNLGKLYNLISLDISVNHLSEIPENALNNLTSLEVLILSKNKFESWTKLNPTYVLQPATSLKILDLSYNKFKTLAANVISPTLETLNLDNCQIESINGESSLEGLINLKVLKLNSNPLLKINNLTSKSLKSLYMSNCLLGNINDSEFTNLPSLIYLRISHNYGLQLATSKVVSESVRYLDISYSNLLRPSLNGFPNIRKVLLSHNMIRYLQSYEFINNTKLEYLDLSYNNIGSLGTDTFHGLSLLKYLDLSWNEIAVVPENSLLEMPSLTQLKLSRNYLTRVGHLKSLSITVLDMSSCEINTIGKDSLEGLQSLVDLDLSHNLISHIPDSISSNTLKHLNLNVNRISFINNFTFFMLPRLTTLSLIGNRFTSIWKRSYFQSNPYLESIELSDNMWRCDCKDENMLDFYEFLTLEPYNKEGSQSLICNSPINVVGQTWLEACYFTWYPSDKGPNPDSLIWFIIIMIIGLASCITIVNCIRNSMKRRLATIQAERERQVEEARDRLRQLRLRAEQEALVNTPDPRDLIPPPTYDEALTMPKLAASCHSLCEAGTGKTRRKRGRRKTKSSGDLLDETERNGDFPVEDLELTEVNDNNRRRRRKSRRCGSHEIAELDHSPGTRRRRISEYNDADDSVTIEVNAELERPLRPRNRRYSSGDPRESDF
ncbi:protein artichoke [Plodia interpunctella]|uniref:protein artichoke n=1 Tax=Plodia interpunctella TaxID=58824 RepID=UPI0031014BAD